MTEEKWYENPTREQSPGYIVEIRQINVSEPLRVAGKMGEISMELSTEWSPLVDPEVGRLAKAIETLSRQLPLPGEWGAAIRRGISPRMQSATVARFTSSQYLTIPIRMEFVAYQDPLRDVVIPCKKLHKMVTPTEGAVRGMIVTPIEVMVTIGRLLRLPRAVLNSVSITYSQELVVGKDNIPLPSKADVDVTIQASYLFVQRDIDEMYWSLAK